MSGSLKPIPELPFEPGWLHQEKNELNALARRVAPLDALLIQLIECRTRRSKHLFPGGPRPKFGAIDMSEFQQFCGRSPRTIALRLAFLEEIRYIDRELAGHKTHRGGYRTLPQNFTSREVPVRKSRHSAQIKRQEAHGGGPVDLAALWVVPSITEPAAPRIAEPEAASVEANVGRTVLQWIAEHAELPPLDEIQRAQSATAKYEVNVGRTDPASCPVAGTGTEAESRAAPPAVEEILQSVGRTSETYCPWGWHCPLIDGPSNASPKQKQYNNRDTVGQSVSGTDLPTPAPAPPSLEHPGLDALAAAIESTGICRELGEPLGGALLLRIRAALREAPVEDLVRKVYRRRKDITSLGLIVNFAGDIYKTWAQDQAHRPSGQPPPRNAAHAETREEKISRLQAKIEASLAIANNKRYPPAERDSQCERIKQIREELVALKADAATGGGT